MVLRRTVEASPGSKKGRATLVPTRPKVALPNGYDALYVLSIDDLWMWLTWFRLTYEEPVAPSKTVVTDPGPYVSGNECVFSIHQIYGPLCRLPARTMTCFRRTRAILCRPPPVIR